MRAKVVPVRERGITVLETMVAVAIFALLTGAAVAGVRGFISQKSLAGWSDTVVNDIRGAQQLGIARRAAAVVTFTNGAPASYTTQVGGATVRSQTLPVPLTITSSSIQFNTLGVPASGVTLSLTDSRTGKTITISVAPVTGAVTAQ